MPAIRKGVRSILKRDGRDGTATYVGEIDREWCISEVPNGGYSLSIIANAVQSFMRLPSNSKGKHFDPLHISANYFVPVSHHQPYTVEIKLLKQGRGVTNVLAELSQTHKVKEEPQVRITAQVIMTSFEARQSDRSLGPTIPKDHEFFTKCPLSSPSECKASNVWSNERFAFRHRLQVLVDKRLIEESRSRRTLDWGCWFNLLGEEDEGDQADEGQLSMGNNVISFFADMMVNPVSNIPKELSFGPAWYPTLQLSIEFKRALPYEKTLTRAGCFSTGKYIIRGQHEIDTEIWSHPDDSDLLNQGQEIKVQGPQILCVSRQLALTVPLKENRSTKVSPGESSSSSSKL
ncbi:hypothetical protein IE53DRAFT_153698 [Violaceomyces palustris]|uniref:Uncharacterized protein n=1 Tax=Violaceomyces palustris TaxID=1673888 RepID=A0ACD0P697_9BASI|nr:hypothetical protein IE53DRAFT_153698 [Violaceomyces palustris]